MPYEHLFEAIAGGGFIGMTGVIAYFMKEQNKKIESMGANLASMRKEIVAIFQDTCHERQEHCMRLVETKMGNLRSKGEIICKKVEDMKDDRKSRWGKQEDLNEKIKQYLHGDVK